MISSYTQACRYCFKLEPSQPKDLVHDIYLWYYDKTKQSLLELRNEEMIKVIRSRWRTLTFRKMFMWRGVRYYKQFVEAGSDYAPSTVVPETTITPYDILVAKDLQARIQSHTTKQESFLLRKTQQGYRMNEVSTMANESYNMTKYRAAMLRNKANKVLSEQ